MIALDTNIVVRLIVNDDPAQTRRAAKVIGAGPVYVTRTVLLEAEWVLRYTYKLRVAAIDHAFQTLLGVPNVEIDEPAVVARALDWYRHGLDFADALHVAACANAAHFVTFDKALVRAARRASTTPQVREV